MDDLYDDEQIVKAKRIPIIALLLSVIAPGLGHLYASHALKGMLLLSAWIIFIIFFSATKIWVHPVFYFLSWSILFGLYFYTIFDSVLCAMRYEGPVQIYNETHYYVVAAMTIISVNVLLFDKSTLFNTQTQAILTDQPATGHIRGDIVLIDSGAYINKAPQLNEVILYEDKSKKNRLVRVIDNPKEATYTVKQYKIQDASVTVQKHQIIGQARFVVYSNRLSRIGKRVINTGTALPR